jgi:hypothetical protein
VFIASKLSRNVVVKARLLNYVYIHLLSNTRLLVINIFLLFLGEAFSDSEDFEDDIILTKAQKALIDNPHSAIYHDAVDLQTSAAMVTWPENTVPYYVPPKLGRKCFCLSWFVFRSCSVSTFSFFVQQRKRK